VKDENSLDPAFVKSELDQAEKKINNIVCEHHWFASEFGPYSPLHPNGEKEDEFLHALGMAHDWLRQAMVYYDEMHENE